MTIPELSIRRPIFITCAFFLIMVVGFLSMMKLPIDLFPNVTFPVVVVSTPYPGAGPAEVETLVTKPIEDEVSTISGIETIRSVNREGLSTVIAEFSLQTDIKYAEQQIRDRVSSVRQKLPDDVEEPVIRRVDPSDQPIVTITLAANLTEAQLYDLADEVVKPSLQQIPQVGLVEILGGRKREIIVELDQKKLKDFEVSASLVSNRIASAGENTPAGSVTRGNDQLTYRTLAEFRSLKDVERVIVNFFANENPVRISDIASVKDHLEDETSRIYLDGVPSVVLMVFRQSGANTVAVADAVKARVAELNQELGKRPEKAALGVVRDLSDRIRANLTDVKESIFIGIVLTILVVLFFLGSVRSTFITGIALPNSLLGAFILMAIAGFTVNVMTLLALSLCVGLLVDDAIVVRENIFRHLEMGKTPRRAAIDGALEVLLAVIATTLTVVAVFGPIGFLQGVVGQFFKEFGLTVCFAMLISLMDSLTMAPMLSAYFAGKAHDVKQAAKIGLLQKALNAFDRFQRRLEDLYEKVLRWTLKRPKTVMAIGAAIFFTSIFITKFIPKTFLPPQDLGEFTVDIDLPPGTSLDGTTEVAQKVVDKIKLNPEIQETLLMVGSRSLEFNKANISVKLVPSKKRKANTTVLKERVRTQLKEFAFANPVVGDYNAVGNGQRPFTLSIAGPDLATLEVYAKKVLEKLKSHAALKDVDVNFRPGKPEFQFEIDPDRAEKLGVSTKSAGVELRTLVEGSVPAVFRQSGREYDIRVRLQENQRDLQERIQSTYVANINNRLIPVQNISKPSRAQGPSTINRENRSRTISVEADIAPDGPGMGAAIQYVNEITGSGELKLPDGMTYSFVGQAKNFKELMTNMVIAMGLGVLFIYLVLASLYESFITPFAIMLVLPLAMCGAFFGLLFFGKSLDIFSMIGCVMLLGVATKNSILLVDYTNQLMRAGVARSEAILQAGRVRLRPILMTSFALIAGMLPVAIGLNEASKQRTGMGVGIIGGLISSTFLTLVIVPAAFSYIDRFKNWIEGWFKRLSGAEDLEAPSTNGQSLTNENHGGLSHANLT